MIVGEEGCQGARRGEEGMRREVGCVAGFGEVGAVGWGEEDWGVGRCCDLRCGGVGHVAVVRAVAAAACGEARLVVPLEGCGERAQAEEQQQAG